MIKVFNRSRKESITRRKFKSYLIYAVGEILLVVIGILIALYVNDKKQDLEIENRTKNLLEEVVKDLENIIYVSNYQLEFYSKKQKLFNLILSDKLTYSDYSESKYQNLTDATTWYTGGNKRQIAYRNLIAEINTIPIEYKSIVRELSLLYENTFNEDYTELIKKTSLENQRKQVDNYEWYSLGIPANQNKEMINFMLNDFRYKNEARFYNQLVNDHIGFIQNDKLKAQKIIKEINITLNNANHGDSDDIDANMKSELLGEWVSIEYPDYSIFIIETDRELYYKSNIDSTHYKLNPVSESLLVDENNTFWAKEETKSGVKIIINDIEFEKW